MPQWPGRDEETFQPVARSEKQHLTVKSKAILALGLSVFALGVYLVGGQQQRSDLGPALAIKQQQLDERDQKIKNLEEQLAQLRQQTQGRANTEEQLASKLKATENELSTVRKRLAAANSEVDRLASRARAGRTADASRPAPANAPVRRKADGGLYETVRPTTVFEEPATSARIVSRISKGTQINVVHSGGEWLEIRSNRGNPSGFIRADDAIVVSRAN